VTQTNMWSVIEATLAAEPIGDALGRNALSFRGLIAAGFCAEALQE
jgi:hypothetical protein